MTKETKENIFTVIAVGLYVGALIEVFKAFEVKQATAIVVLIAMGDLLPQRKGSEEANK